MVAHDRISCLTGLYVGYFARAPLPAELRFWLEQCERGRELQSTSQGLAESVEAQYLYPYLNDPEVGCLISFLTSIYQNLFDRLPDAAGLGFWSGQLENGFISSGGLVAAIFEGAAGDDAVLVKNKIEVACHWTASVSRAANFKYDDSAAKAAKAALEKVTISQASVKAAKTRTDLYVLGRLGKAGCYSENPSVRTRVLH